MTMFNQGLMALMNEYCTKECGAYGTAECKTCEVPAFVEFMTKETKAVAYMVENKDPEPLTEMAVIALGGKEGAIAGMDAFKRMARFIAYPDFNGRREALSTGTRKGGVHRREDHFARPYVLLHYR